MSEETGGVGELQEPTTTVLAENGTRRVERHMDAEGAVSFRGYDGDELIETFMSRGRSLDWLNG